MRLDKVQGDIHAPQGRIVGVLEALQVPLEHGVPLMARASRSMPTSRRFSWMNPFMASGSILAELEVEISMLLLTRLLSPLYPACCNKSLGLVGLYS